ncbi:hypothetical protein POPTR_008G073001v4 [Populus trichocarpa]|uniref:Uncharacterized protein n=1 Tax=Populus trichocarpa TaxID=3694 RepID=A0ACC0SK94_POPTR|nr:hypothetical protein POPTR_008G073001v4 [Populus trichocarpa]
MQGGYVNDKWVQGGTNPDAYATWHWYLIDVFVYFSHSLVTLPPPCWTNTAHRRGVKVFGTFITEWDEGKLVRNKLLATMKSARMNAERLAELAVDLGFDGWLSNYPDLSAAVAGNRKFDVYMGMDVFGRKTFGGGQWNVVSTLSLSNHVIPLLVGTDHCLNVVHDLHKCKHQACFQALTNLILFRVKAIVFLSRATN